MVTLLSYCDLPEITEEALTRELAATGGEAAADVGPFYKQYHCIFGFVAQMCYVCVPLSQSLWCPTTSGLNDDAFCSGAQVGVASFTVNYLVDQGVGISHSRASLMFAFCQLTFTGGRFIGAGLLRFIDTAFLLSLYGVACVTCCLGTALSTGNRGVASLFLLFFFESICYPVRLFPPLLSRARADVPFAVCFHPRNAWLRTAHEARIKSDSHGTCKRLNQRKKRKESAEQSYAGRGRRRVVPACARCVGRQVFHATLVPGPARGLHRDDLICHVRALFPRISFVLLEFGG